MNKKSQIIKILILIGLLCLFGLGLTEEVEIDGFLFDSEQGIITAYVGEAEEIEIPEMLGGTKVLGIGDNAFASSKLKKPLTKLTLKEGLESIGAGAFDGNRLTALTLPNSVKTIGVNAFTSNAIENLVISEGSQLNELGTSAFSSNSISSIDLSKATSLNTIGTDAFSNNKATELKLPEGLKGIGEKAFEKNQLTSVAVPSSVNAIGAGAFSDNGRYVILEGDSAALKSDITPGFFGAIYQPVELWYSGFEKGTDVQILSAQLLRNDYTVEKPENELLFKGNTIKYPNPVSIKGYLIESGADILLDDAFLNGNKEETPLKLEYEKNINPPVIEGLKILRVEIDAVVDKQALAAGVTAKDSKGIDLTASIVFTPENIDTSTKGTHEVTYSVTDSSDLTTVEKRTVLVGMNPMEIETGNGWVLGDFEYGTGANKNTVVGFSARGLEKLKENKSVVLPHINPNNFDDDNPQITKIGSSAFRANEIIEARIPDSIKVIEDSAFDSNKLEFIDLPASIEKIGDRAFGGNNISSLRLPGSLKAPNAIGQSCFADNKITSLTLDEGITEIGANAFQNNEIATLKTPDSLKKIGSYAFKENKIADLKLNDELEEISSGAFKNNSLATIQLPEKLKKLGDFAFESNQLETVIVPDSVTNDNMGEGVFKDNHITSFELPNHFTKIPDHTFNSNWLKSVEIPSNITEIGNAAFENNTMLKTLKLHDDITKIGDYAFQRAAIEMDEFVTSPKLKYIGSYAFDGSGSFGMTIKKLVVSKELERLGTAAFQSVNMLDLTIEDGTRLTQIENRVFYNNKLNRESNGNKKPLKIPEGITSIGSEAFSNNQTIEDLELPKSLKSIGGSAFYGNKIDKLDLNDYSNLTSIGSQAFYNNLIDELKLPEKLTWIGSGAFQYNRITEVKLPKGVTALESGVFANNLLTKVELSSDTTRIGANAFYNNRLSDIKLPEKLESISANAFGQNLLAKLDVPDSVKSIGTAAFKDNKIKELKLPNNPDFKAISSTAFSKNELEKVVLPPNVETIGEEAFANNAIKAVETTAGSKLNSIGERAFQNNKFTEVDLPLSTKQIAPKAFDMNPGWEEKPGIVNVMLKNPGGEPSNPNNIENNATYVINEGLVEYRLLNRKDNQPIADNVKVFGKIGEKAKFKVESMQKYLAEKPGVIETPITKGKQVVDVYYKNIDDFNNTAVKIELYHADEYYKKLSNGNESGLKIFGVSSIHTPKFNIHIKNSGATESFENINVEIDLNSTFPGGNVDPSSFTFVNNIADFVKGGKDGVRFENGKLIFPLKDKLTPGAELNFGFGFKFLYNTPDHFVTDLTEKAAITSPEGIPLFKSTNKLGAGLYQGTHYSSKDVKTDRTYYDDQFDSDDCLLPGEEINESAQIIYNPSGLYREESKIIYKDTLPKYTGKDHATGEIKEMYAKFDPALNPGWTQISEGVVQYEGLGVSGRNYVYSYIVLSYPGLKIPKNSTTTVTNGGSTQPIMDNRGKVIKDDPGKDWVKKFNEPGSFKDKLSDEEYKEDTTSDNHYNYRRPRPEIVPHQIPVPRFGKATKDFVSGYYSPPADNAVIRSYEISNHKFTYLGSDMWYGWNNTQAGNNKASGIPDTVKYRNKEILWGIGADLPNTKVKKLLIQDVNMNEDLRYTGIYLVDSLVQTAKLRVYDDLQAKGNLLLETDIYNARFDFPEAISQKAKSFSLEINDTTFAKTGYKQYYYKLAGVYTKFRHPESSIFHQEGETNSIAHEKNFKKNYINVEIEGYDIAQEKDYTYKYDTVEDMRTGVVRILPDESRIKLVKGIVNGEGTVPNSIIDYPLSIETYKEPTEVIKKLKIIDILPAYMQPAGYELSKEFKRFAKNPRVEYIQNYIPANGDEVARWAVLITADSFAPDPDAEDKLEKKYDIVTVKALVEAEIKPGKYRNIAYFSAEDGPGGLEKPDKKKDSVIGVDLNLDDPNIKIKDALKKKLADEFGDPKYKSVYTDSKDNVMALGSKVIGIKHVRVKGEQIWSRDVKIPNGGQFEYRLKATNPTSSVLENYQLIDVLPYNDDLRLMPNSEGVRQPRSTGLSGYDRHGQLIHTRVFMTGPVRLDAKLNADDYEVLYTDSSVDVLRQYDANQLKTKITWKTAAELGNKFDKVTGFFIKSKPGKGILPESTANFYVDMQMEKYEDYIFDEKLASNSFAHKAGPDGTDFVEVDHVSVEPISPRTTLKIRKYGLEISPKLGDNGEPIVGADGKKIWVDENGKPIMKRKLLPGAKFKLWATYVENLDIDKQSEMVNGIKVITPSVKTGLQGGVEYYTSDEYGEIEIPGLFTNRDYILEEISAPTGYKFKKGQKFTVVKKEDIKAHEGKTYELDVENEKIYMMTPMVPLTGTVRLYKFSVANKPLVGTGFKLVARNIETGEVKQSWSAFAQPTGLVEFTELPLYGDKYEYVLTETQPRGVLQAIAEKKIKFKDNNGENPVVDLGKIENDKAQLRVLKLGLYNIAEMNKPIHKLVAGAGRRLSGVKIELQREDGSVIETQTTTKLGEVRFKNLEINKVYYLFEPEVPEGFKGYENPATNNRIKISINSYGGVLVNDVLSANNYVVYKNEPIKKTNYVQIIKKDAEDHEVLLGGAKFDLYEIKPDGRKIYIKSAETTEDGICEFVDFAIDTVTGQLRKAEFEIYESRAPKYYQRSFVPIKFSTNDASYSFKEFEAFNNRIKLNIKKVDTETNAPLADVQFALYASKDGTGDPVEIAKTEANGIAVFKYDKFEIGKSYSVKEVKSKTGYIFDPDKVELFDLNGISNQLTFTGIHTMRLNNQKAYGRLQVDKLDKDTRERLDGVEFVLVDTTVGADKEPDRKVETVGGTAMFNKLTIGKKYKLSETKTKLGYIEGENQDIEISITEAKTKLVTLYNTRPSRKLVLDKMGEFDVGLKGVKFELSRLIGNKTWVKLEEAVSDETGKVSFNSPIKNQEKYRVVEIDASEATLLDGNKDTNAPFGYKLNKAEFFAEIEVDDEGEAFISFTEKDGENEASQLETEGEGFEIRNDREEPKKVSVSVEKTFNGGTELDYMPKFYVQLYRQSDKTAKEPVGEKKELVKKAGAENVLEAKFEGLDYDEKDEENRRYCKFTYSVEEVIQPGFENLFNPVVQETATNDELKKSFTIENRYIQPKGEVKAVKFWYGANDKDNNPDVMLKLYRKTAKMAEMEAVPDAAVITLHGLEREAVWQEIVQNDFNGNQYSFFVKEVDAEGNPSVPDGYRKVENNLRVENIPIIDIKVKKLWVDGPKDKPDVEIELKRKLEGGEFEAIENGVVKTLKSGESELSFEGLNRTTDDGREYIFGAFEKPVEGYETEGEGTLEITNTYVPPKGEIKAEKIWGSKTDNYPKIYFKLLRNIEGEEAAEVPGVDVVAIENGAVEAVWQDIELKDRQGRDYIFSVMETDENGKDYVPENWAKTEEGLKVTNAFRTGKIDVTATKKWVDGPRKKPTIYFELYRSVKGGELEKVPENEAVVMKLESGTNEATWKDMAEFNELGEPYEYAVCEVNSKGEKKAPSGYSVSGQESLEITNTYEIPYGKVKATKVWQDELNEHPEIYFKLYRKFGRNGEVLPVYGAEIKKLENGVTEVVWSGMQKTDSTGTHYFYSVKEVDKDGNDYVPVGYEKLEEGLKVTNTLKHVKAPKTGDTSNILISSIVAVLALAGIYFISRKSKKDNNSQNKQ